MKKQKLDNINLITFNGQVFKMNCAPWHKYFESLDLIEIPVVLMF